MAFSAMVARAVAMESQAKRASEVGFAMASRSAEYRSSGLRFAPFRNVALSKLAFACLKGAHAPPGLRRRGRVQRESTPLAARTAQARVPRRAAPGAHRRRGHATLLPLPEPQRGRADAARGLEARIRPFRSDRAERSLRLGRAPRAHLALQADLDRLPGDPRLDNRSLRHLDAGARSERAHEHRPGAAGAAGSARATPARRGAVRGGPR